MIQNVVENVRIVHIPAQSGPRMETYSESSPCLITTTWRRKRLKGCFQCQPRRQVNEFIRETWGGGHLHCDVVRPLLGGLCV